MQLGEHFQHQNLNQFGSWKPSILGVILVRDSLSLRIQERTVAVEAGASKGFFTPGGASVHLVSIVTSAALITTLPAYSLTSSALLLTLLVLTQGKNEQPWGQRECLEVVGNCGLHPSHTGWLAQFVFEYRLDLMKQPVLSKPSPIRHRQARRQASLMAQQQRQSNQEHRRVEEKALKTVEALQLNLAIGEDGCGTKSLIYLCDKNMKKQ